MTHIVILCRHGNTFEKGQKAFMVGAREDLPLTAFGVEQGNAVGRAIKTTGLRPRRIISGPLLRTRVFAERVARETGAEVSIEIDPRLVEFDYGSWSGLTNEEIIELSGAEALARWQEQSIRPAGVSFTPSEEVARDEARALLRDLESSDGCSVVVTSNGRLREFGYVLAGGLAGGVPQSFKVKTGHSCVLIREGDSWKLLGWDLSAQELEQVVHRLSE